MIGRVGDRPGAVLALAKRVDGAGRQVGAEAVVQRRVARLRDKVGDAGSGVDVNEVRPFAAERLGIERLREAAFERDHEGLVNLVAVVVDHHDDATVVGEDEEWVAADQLRILEGNPGREQRLGDAAGGVHRIEAQPAGQVADEVEPVIHELGTEEEPS